LWGEALGEGLHFVIEDISVDPARMILADGRTALWPTADLPPAFAWLKTHFMAWGVRALLVAPMMMAGQLAGIIGVRFDGARIFGRDEIELTKALADQAMLAMKLMRLSEQSRDTAVMAERNRMARDIHDTLAQGFTGVIVQLEAAKGAIAMGQLDDTGTRIHRASELARASLQEARRSVLALRPRGLRNGTLCGAIEDLLRRMTEGTRLKATFEVAGAVQPMAAECQENLLHIAQEALTNTIKHASASNFRAKLIFGLREVEMHFDDNGRGFDPTIEHDGFGLIGMKERVDRMHGEFVIRSGVGLGTQVNVIVEIASSKGPS
jgi:signal transduction histidine kinase